MEIIQIVETVESIPLYRTCMRCPTHQSTRSPHTAATQMATGTVTHRHCPFAPFPTTCTPTDEDVPAPSWVLGDRQPLIRFLDEEGIYYHGQLVPLLLATAREHPL